MDASRFASVLKQTFEVDNNGNRNSGNGVDFQLGKVVSVSSNKIKVIRDVDIISKTTITCRATNELLSSGYLKAGTTVLLLNGIAIATLERG